MPAAPDATALTRELLRFDTINPPGQEEACARHLGELLEHAGFQVTYSAFAPARTSLVARIGGGKAKPALGFTGHIDTVPLGATRWQKNAFGGTQEAGKLYGRGSSDMKSGVAAFVVAALRLAGKLKDSPGLILAITADEECGCGGAAHLVRKGVLGTVGALLVGEPTANYPLVGHKGALWLNARTHGVTAHGSMPERGDNAIYKATAAVTKLAQFDFGVASHPLMGKPTLNVGMIHGGLNINSVPDEANVGVDIRTIAGMDHAALLRQLAALVGPEVRLEPLIDVQAIYSHPEQPWIQSVFEAMRGPLGERPEPRTATYFTDAAVLKRTWDVPTVILGPGEPQLAHQTDEYCLIDRVEQAADAYSRIISDWNF